MEQWAEAVGFAHAKINLFLDVTGRRADGYHLIDGVMQSVTLGDRVCVRAARAASSEIALKVTGAAESVPCDGRNLAYRAAEAFLTATGLALNVEITLEKTIPVAGGLAGGSTDAAFVLRKLNQLTDHPLTEGALLALGERLGADIPFCIAGRGGAMRTEGIGEILTPVPPLPDCAIVIARAGEGVSTPWAYQALDAQYGREDPQERQARALRLQALLRALEDGDLDRVCRQCWNIFETVVIPCRPRVQAVKEQLLRAGARLAMMSGSGPSVFGIFTDQAEAERACRELRAGGAVAALCRPMRERA